ncbi:DgyrCDS2960 [Dimorphilus gyrociliatus]|uniref:DgyrCDS2960 n=1 Tax=Dimorphilus gyrociliatus TaxID=2664684 RepID=A0A7I8VD03_9ANNE|nr:DgyrCDS2960 [Dimorphilus gyrociliatus]
MSYFKNHSLYALFEKEQDFLLETIKDWRKSIKSERAFRLLIDCDETIQRLYGGFLHDFTSGGDWGSSYKFLENLCFTSSKNRIELVFAFRGAIDKSQSLWRKVRLFNSELAKNNIISIEDSRKLPTKKYWVAPNSARFFIQSMLQHLNQIVIVSEKADIREMVKLYAIDGVVTNDISFFFSATFDTKLYLGSSLKLTFSGTMSMKEIKLKKLLECLELDVERLPILGSLLENPYILREEFFTFYLDLFSLRNPDELDSIDNFELIVGVSAFVKKLKSHTDLEGIAKCVFINYSDSEKEVLSAKFIKCAKYYAKYHNLSNFTYGDETEERENTIIKKQITRSVDSQVQRNALKIATDRYTTGCMHPWILQILSKREIEIPNIWNVDCFRMGSNMNDMFRPLRAKAYNILLQQSGTENSKPNKILVKEYFVGSEGEIKEFDIEVKPKKANYLSLSHLWWGKENQHKKLREMALRYCTLNNDANIFDPKVIPEELMTLCLLLRYLLSQKTRVLTSNEFDAIIVAAVDSRLSAGTAFEFNSSEFTTRSSYIGQMLSLGIEHILFLNDVCAQPLPASSCHPWKFLYGRILQHKLFLLNSGCSLEFALEDDRNKLSLVKSLRNAILCDLEKNNPFLSCQSISKERSVSEIDKGIESDRSNYESMSTDSTQFIINVINNMLRFLL